MHINGAEEKQFFYVVKAIAIFGTVCAHSANVLESASAINKISSYLLVCWGTSGVPVFFFLSGYFFGGNDKGWKDFWKNKVKTVIIPWIFCATVLWLYVVLRKGGISLESWIKFVIGDGSSMYYITMLLLMYALFLLLRKNTALTFCLCGISGISIIASCMGHNILNGWFLNSYLNPFNWILYFGVGLLVRKSDYIQKYISVCKTIFPVTTLVYVAILALHYINGWAWSYWSEWAVFNIAVQTLWSFGAAYYIWECVPFRKHIVTIGVYSYTIYLCHQLLVGFFVAITNLLDCFFFTLLRPAITISVMYAGISIAKKYLPKLQRLFMLIGLRTV